ncbi:MAG TPA: DUF6491 family protein [Wenzhouxiangella sp.]|nr:DUF6491 family protein [Wenzhouxiangella sp.]
MRTVLITLLAVVIAGCATGDRRQSAEDEALNQQAVYQRHAGATQSWVRYTRIRNWWPVGLSSVALQTGPSQHYLLELTGACDLSLDRAIAVRLVTRSTNVLSEGDELVADGRRCRVRAIRPLDYGAVQAELGDDAGERGRRQGQVEVHSREQAPQPSGGV